jgi:hypothetical protein
METLLNNVKNETVSHQTFMRKAKIKKLIWIKKRICDLKTDFAANTDEIFAQEKELNLLMDIEMRSELENFRHYDILNGEKMTPRFLALTKINKKTASLDCIRQNDGTPFVSCGERYRYIKSFYEEIYAVKEGTVLNNDCIEDFLGPEANNNPLVRESKLNPEEQQLFDN